MYKPTYHTPVSYTHLDVYKRQEEHSLYLFVRNVCTLRMC